MTCTYSEHEVEAVAEIRVTGRVTQSDMDHILPRIQALIQKHGSIRLVEVIESFEGIDPGTFFDGLNFDYHHLRDVTHAAVVSDIGWIGVLTRASSLVVPVSVRTFSLNELQKARDWALDPDGSENMPV